MAKLDWARVWKVQCKKCKVWVSPIKKGKVPGHLPQGQPTSSSDCSGSGKSYDKVKDMDGNVYDA